MFRVGGKFNVLLSSLQLSNIHGFLALWRTLFCDISTERYPDGPNSKPSAGYGVGPWMDTMIAVRAARAARAG